VLQIQTESHTDN